MNAFAMQANTLTPETPDFLTEHFWAFLGVFFTGLFGLLAVVLQRRQSRRGGEAGGAVNTQTEPELINSAAGERDEYVAQMGQVWQEISILQQETEIDRWILFVGHNGDERALWTDGIMQIRRDGQRFKRFKHTELDDHYRGLMAVMYDKGYVRIDVSQAPSSLIKHIYEAEGVKFAVWFLIARQDIDGKTKIWYCSYASHKNPITETTITECRLIVDQLKDIYG